MIALSEDYNSENVINFCWNACLGPILLTGNSQLIASRFTILVSIYALVYNYFCENRILLKWIPGLSEVHEGFRRGHVLLLHQVGGDDGRGARVAQEAVDEDQAVGEAQCAVDELN